VTQLRRAFAPLSPALCYSIKSCHNLHILRLLRGHGVSFDAVSGGEVRRALEAGADPGTIVFAGVGKTAAEITEAIDAGVGWFNVESPAELRVLAELATARGVKVKAALRVNPDVDAHTHPYTTTGRDENKFGVEMTQARALFVEYRQHPHVAVAGVHIHIGSPVNTVEPYTAMIHKALALIEDLRREGVAITSFNIGGGFGDAYGTEAVPPISAYASAIVPLLEGRDLHVHLEPGRTISANSAVLLTEVLYLKHSRNKQFVVVDAAMTDLIRPALYQAFHFIWPVRCPPAMVPSTPAPQIERDGLTRVDVVGPVCETGDFLGRNRDLPPLATHDLLAVFSAGAYGAVMSSQYNSRPRAAEVLVDGTTTRLIRRRESYDDLVAAERDAS
jgi:diaminopimelate decarboxylase